MFSPELHTEDTFNMSTNDVSVHTQNCSESSDGMAFSDLPDEVTSIDDLECRCWDEFDSPDEIE